MRSSLTHAVIGITAAAVVCAIVDQVRSAHGLEFLAAFLALTAASYFGSALTDGRRHILVLESLVSLLVFAAALAGIWVSTVWLAVGYVGHGLWDVLHHPHRMGAPVRTPWFPPACLGFDWVVAAYIVWSVW